MSKEGCVTATSKTPRALAISPQFISIHHICHTYIAYDLIMTMFELSLVAVSSRI